VRALVFLALVACGGRSSTPQKPAAPAPHDAAVAVAEPPPSDADCDALIAHAVALAAAGQPKATDDDQVRARADLKTQYGASCRQMTRAHYLCALSAPTLDSISGCAE